ncbi:MAG: hypothetical protein EOM28_04190 [Clostridia bacterium]|nr:hypothetical protein [Clostridia bacterium]
MKKINWRIFNLALWIEIFLSYLLPFKVIDDFEYKIGFPIPFISIYDSVIGINPFTSMSVNPFGFLLDGFIISFIIMFIVKSYYKIKHNTAK